MSPRSRAREANTVSLSSSVSPRENFNLFSDNQAPHDSSRALSSARVCASERGKSRGWQAAWLQREQELSRLVW